MHGHQSLEIKSSDGISFRIAFIWPKKRKAITLKTVYIGIATIIANGPPTYPTISITKKTSSGFALMLVEYING